MKISKILEIAIMAAIAAWLSYEILIIFLKLIY